MIDGQAALQGLLEDPSITSLLSDPNFIFYDNVVPDGVVGAEESTINYYRVGPIDGGLSFMSAQYSVNCRAKSMIEAATLSLAVYDVLNRHSNDSIFFVSSMLATIPPADQTDVYNSPLEVTAKGRDI